jgi:aryl-alcohol dehydrogenase-like predicted oxidoreductase
MMDYRRLAGTDLDVSVLCFGPTRTAAAEIGDDPRTLEGTRAFHAALDAGINLIHSSYEYRLGSMVMMGSALKSHPKRHDVHHVVKVPAPDFDDEDTFAEARFRQRVEEALAMFHADRISVVQYMWRSNPNTDERRVPALPRIIEDVASTFEKMRDEGKVGHLLTFPYTMSATRVALDSGKFQGLIAYCNPLTFEVGELLPELERRGLGFIAIRPFFEGLLTDKRSNKDCLPPDDRLRSYDVDGLFRMRETVCAAFAEQIGDSLTGFALRFPLYSAATASVVVGLNTVKQVEDAVRLVGRVQPDPGIVRRAHDLWKTQIKLPAWT